MFFLIFLKVLILIMNFMSQGFGLQKGVERRGLFHVLVLIASTVVHLVCFEDIEAVARKKACELSAKALLVAIIGWHGRNLSSEISYSTMTILPCWYR